MNGQVTPYGTETATNNQNKELMSSEKKENQYQIVQIVDQPVLENKHLWKNIRNTYNVEVDSKQINQKHLDDSLVDLDSTVNEESESEQQYIEKYLYLKHSKSGKVFTVDQRGADLGSHILNNILIEDEDICPFHAQIHYNLSDNQYQVQDLGSENGTYISNYDSENNFIAKNNIFNLGNHLLDIQNIKRNVDEKKVIINIKVVHVKDRRINFVVTQKKQKKFKEYEFELSQQNDVVSIGKNKKCQIQITNDSLIDDQHAEIQLDISKLQLKLVNKNQNQVWIQISKEGVKSQPIILKNQVQIKFGNKYIYDIEIEDKENTQFKYIAGGIPWPFCIKCKENKATIVLIPCEDYSYCSQCFYAIDRNQNNNNKCGICQRDYYDYMEETTFDY